MNRTSTLPAAAGRWLRRIALALLVVYGLYLLLANAWINTALGEYTLNRKPEKFRMQWTSGHSWWPGRVALRGVRLRGQTRRIAWHAEAARVEGAIALAPLFRRELHVPVVFADEVAGGVETAERELPAPPVRPDGWVLRFDRITSASVRKGSFQGFRLEGQGNAQVGFVKQLRGGPMELLPSHARFAHARLSADGSEWLRAATVEADFAIAKHRRGEAVGLRKLLKTEARVKLDGSTAGLDIKVSPEGKVAIAAGPGQGQAHIDLAYAHGALKPGSRLHWTMPVTGNDIAGAARHDAVDVAVSADRDIVVKAMVPSQADGRLSVDADLRLRGTDLPLRDFQSLLPRASGHVVARWRFGSLRWLGNFFPQAPWLSLEGAGDIDADVRVVAGKLAAGSRIGVPEVDAVAVVMGNRIRGTARADIRLEEGKAGELVPRLDAVMERFHIAALETPQRPYVRGRNLRVQLNADGRLAQLRDSLKGRVTFKDATVPDLRAYNRYLPQTHLRFEGGSGTVDGDLSLDTRGDVGQGRLRIAGRRTRLTMGGIALRGDVDIDTRLRRADLARRHFVLDGSVVRLGNVSFQEPGGESRTGWWARIGLPGARMDLDKPFTVTGRADVAMKDVGFLLSLFSRQKEYPKWVYRLIDAGQAQVGGQVQWRDDVLVLDRMQAKNQRYDLKARLRLQGKRRTGNLYAEWGVLSLGVDLEGDRRQFHLVRARRWYDAQPDLLR